MQNAATVVLFFKKKRTQSSGSSFAFPSLFDECFPCSRYLQGAMQGDAPTQCNLGLSYKEGLPGEPPDGKSAMLWFSRAAEQGLERKEGRKKERKKKKKNLTLHCDIFFFWFQTNNFTLSHRFLFLSSLLRSPCWLVVFLFAGSLSGYFNLAVSGRCNRRGVFFGRSRAFGGKESALPWLLFLLLFLFNGSVMLRERRRLRGKR